MTRAGQAVTGSSALASPVAITARLPGRLPTRSPGSGTRSSSAPAAAARRTAPAAGQAGQIRQALDDVDPRRQAYAVRWPGIGDLGAVTVPDADAVVDVLEAERLHANGVHTGVHQPLRALRCDIRLADQVLVRSARFLPGIDQHDVTAADARAGLGEVAAGQPASSRVGAVDNHGLAEQSREVELVDARGAADDVAGRVDVRAEVIVQRPLTLRAVVALLPAPQPGEFQGLDRGVADREPAGQRNQGVVCQRPGQVVDRR